MFVSWRAGNLPGFLSGDRPFFIYFGIFDYIIELYNFYILILINSSQVYAKPIFSVLARLPIHVRFQLGQLGRDYGPQDPESFCVPWHRVPTLLSSFRTNT